MISSSPGPEPSEEPESDDAGSDTQADPDADTADASSRPDRSSTYQTLIGWGLLGVGVLAIAWICVTAVIARSQLNDVRHDLPRLRAAIDQGELVQARTLAAQIETHARRAHELTSGPAWWTAAHLPFVGTPLRTSRVIASAADDLGSRALPGVVNLAGQVRGLVHGSQIDVDALARLQPQLDSAAATVHSAAVQLDATPGSWLKPVASARSSVVTQLTTLDGEIGGASRALHIAVPMLGEGGPKRYFVGFLNEAESRGLGGIPGSYAIVTADRGRITFDRFGSDSDFGNVRANVDLGTEFNARYGNNDPTGVMPNSTLSPDFRDAAQIWAGMWQAKTGQHIDGAIALDPTALSYLLQVTGPAKLPDGSSVDASNVVALTQQDQYSRYPVNSPTQNQERKRYLIGIAKAVSTRLTSLTSSGQMAEHLVKALSHAAQERRLVVYSADAETEKRLLVSGWSGALIPSGDAVTGFVVNNGSGGKIDYYLDRTTNYRRSTCSAGGTAVATFTVTNTAPTTGLPPYVTIRLDPGARGSKPGSELLLVAYYGTPGARIRSVTLDGKPVTVAPMTENGLITAALNVDLPPGATRTVRVELTEPTAAGSVQTIQQPLVQAGSVQTSSPTCP